MGSIKKKNIADLFLENEGLNARLKCKPTLLEVASITFVFGLAIYFTFSHTGSFSDYKVYLAAANGDSSNYFYGYWLLPFFYLLSLFPFEAGYLLWIVLSILGVWFAARVFNGKSSLALLSYQMSYALFLGQITGIICGALALFWWAISKRKWDLAGIALLILAGKPQSGGVFVFFLWVFADITWREKIRILVIPVIGIILSLILYPSWVFEIISRVSMVNSIGNISLWQWAGPYSLLLLLPAIIVPMNKSKRFFVLISASILAIPYFLHTELLTLFIFPINSFFILLGYLPGIMFQFIAYIGHKSAVVVPLLIYIWQIVPEITKWLNNKNSHNSTIINN